MRDLPGLSAPQRTTAENYRVSLSAKDDIDGSRFLLYCLVIQKSSNEMKQTEITANQEKIGKTARRRRLNSLQISGRYQVDGVSRGKHRIDHVIIEGQSPSG